MSVPEVNQSETDHPYGVLAPAAERAILQPSNLAVRMMTKADIMEALLATIPPNEFGLPLYYYRADLIPGDLHELTQAEQVICTENAKEDILTFEGFPTFKNGNPFWGSMESESTVAYAYFKVYLELCEDTAIHIRQLHRVCEVAATQGMQVPTYEYLYELFHVNYWAPRARAYDLFQAVAEQRRQEKLRLTAENRISSMATKLYTKGESTLALYSEKEISPSEAIALLKLALDMDKSVTGIGRRDPEDRENAKVDRLMRDTALKAGDVQDNQFTDDESEALAEALKDPETMNKLQSIIIEARQSAKGKVAQKVISDSSEGAEGSEDE